MDISIISVNYNTQAHLSKTLKSIFNATENLDFEILVADNNK
jgi:GT2 family glycosyltransferase